jgi:hypothetical protein
MDTNRPTAFFMGPGGVPLSQDLHKPEVLQCRSG